MDKYKLGVLNEREKTHGDFTEVARMAQRLKDSLRCTKHPGLRLSAMHSEALDMICTKLARIVCGNPDEPDHWQDIIGYATLAMPKPLPTPTDLIRATSFKEAAEREQRKTEINKSWVIELPFADESSAQREYSRIVANCGYTGRITHRGY